VLVKVADMERFERAARYLMAVILMVAIGLPATGCGGSSSGSTGRPGTAAATTAPRPQSGTSSDPSGGTVKSRFIAAADAICGRLNAAIADPLGTVLNDTNLARLAPAHALLEKKAVSELGRLKPPESLASDWLKLLAYRRTLAKELAEVGAAAKAHDAASIKKLGASKKRVHRQLEALAARDGFGPCGEAGGTTLVPRTPPKAVAPKRNT
jgi:hypothetical protein